MPRHSRRLKFALCLGIVALAGGVEHAAASWLMSTAGQSATYSTAVLTPASSLSATTRCRLLAATVDLAWTATTSPKVTGYRILRRTDSSSYSTVATLTNPATTSYNDATVSINVRYTYLVRAVRNSWHVDSSAANVTTPIICL